MQNFTDVPLKEVAKILRGVVTKPQEIKERTAPENSGIFFLTVSDIQENYLSHSMKCLKNIEPREEKHCLMENDIVIAKMGQPKTGLARDLGEKKIIVSQNLYILRLILAGLILFMPGLFLKVPWVWHGWKKPM